MKLETVGPVIEVMPGKVIKPSKEIYQGTEVRNVFTGTVCCEVISDVKIEVIGRKDSVKKEDLILVEGNAIQAWDAGIKRHYLIPTRAILFKGTVEPGEKFIRLDDAEKDPMIRAEKSVIIGTGKPSIII